MSDTTTVDHTPGKLTVRASANFANAFFLDSETGWLMSIQHNGEQLEAKQAMNVRRLAAAWNMTRRMPIELIERFAAGLDEPYTPMLLPTSKGLHMQRFGRMTRTGQPEFKSCIDCEGSGFIAVHGEEDQQPCPLCAGTGRFEYSAHPPA